MNFLEIRCVRCKISKLCQGYKTNLLDGWQRMVKQKQLKRMTSNDDQKDVDTEQKDVKKNKYAKAKPEDCG